MKKSINVIIIHQRQQTKYIKKNGNPTTAPKTRNHENGAEGIVAQAKTEVSIK